jgi:hypothetical protein
MSRFAPVLRRISAGLDLPQATKSRILLEMAGDMEDLYQHHLSRGSDEAEALRRAEEAFAASDEALKHLARVHERGGRFADRVTSQVGSIWEKALLLIWVLAVILLVGTVATEERFFVIVSPFIWPIAGLALAALALALRKLNELFLKKPPDVRRLRSGLSVLLFLAGASLAVSGCGLLYHMRWYADQAVEGAPETVFMMYAGWMLASSSMMIVGLLTAILTALVWFMLASLVSRAENREADTLLGN